ncbi:hypothetical protein [Prosthecobacter dejongeii]|uniref:Lipoprotein n=1 Tax=Prosthecobacter dejongeii TaxID=48465 RepID=A0A7W7YMQ1_9BACT|nr:hypothetical protein [Prosthecobacter dejongeii]MBB5038817.1 hypothetical protein [Prosthecobacter dejongeii]
MRLRHVFLLSLAASLSACVSSMPTAEKLDELEQKIRAEYRQEYVLLEDQRRSGALDAEGYQISKARLDQRVQNRVDTMAWSRHALVQSEMKANAIPTPDSPQINTPPGVGSLQGSVYNSTRQNGIGSQALGNLVRDMSSGGGAGGRNPGTMYDNP